MYVLPDLVEATIAIIILAVVNENLLGCASLVDSLHHRLTIRLV